jgi:hypothetical protein
VPANFNGLLKQAFTLGVRQATPSELPEAFAFMVHSGLFAVACATAMFKLDATIAATVLLFSSIAAFIGALVFLEDTIAISPIVLNILTVVVVLGFFVLAAHVVIQIQGA